MRSGHAGLVLPPLFLTMVFCFALVLVQQYQTNTRAAASKQQAYNKAHPKLSPKSLQTITPLTPITVAPPPAAAANSANPKVTAPPQPSKTSGSAVQGAGQNTQPQSVIDGVAKPVERTLSNLRH